MMLPKNRDGDVAAAAGAVVGGHSVHCRVVAEGRVWEAAGDQRLGPEKSGRRFDYRREFDMPGPPTPGMLLKFEPAAGTWLRVLVREVEWHVDRAAYLCRTEDLLLPALGGVASLAEAAALFASVGLVVDRTAFDASDADRARREAERRQVLRLREIASTLDDESKDDGQAKFEDDIPRFSDLDEDGRSNVDRGRPYRG